MTDNNKKKQEISDFLSESISSDLVDDLADYCLQDIWDDSEHLQDYFTDRFYEMTGEQFVYCYDAIKYLSENDISLQSSIELADELGYNLKKIDSCALANILYQNDRLEELGEVNFQELFDLINQ
jgi:hypothetical protein